MDSRLPDFEAPGHLGGASEPQRHCCLAVSAAADACCHAVSCRRVLGAPPRLAISPGIRCDRRGRIFVEEARFLTVENVHELALLACLANLAGPSGDGSVVYAPRLPVKRLVRQSMTIDDVSQPA